AVTLLEKDRHYSGPSSSFVRRDYVSPVLYARFPTALKISHAWVYTAQAQNDGPFGWQAQGLVRCDPSPQRTRLIFVGRRNVGRSEFTWDIYKLDPRDADALSATPTSASLILNAQTSKPLQNAT